MIKIKHVKNFLHLWEKGKAGKRKGGGKERGIKGGRGRDEFCAVVIVPLSACSQYPVITCSMRE